MELALQEAPYRRFLSTGEESAKDSKDVWIYCLPTSTTEYVQHSDESALIRTKLLLHGNCSVAVYSVEKGDFLGGSDIASSQAHPAFMALNQLDVQAAKEIVDPASKRQDVVIVVGSGGREHALAVAVAKSPLVAKVICCPGNGGTAVEGGKICNAEGVNGKQDNATVIDLVKREKAQMVVVGPEAPLVAGLVDEMKVTCPDVMAFGPSKAAAELEASKVGGYYVSMNLHTPNIIFQSTHGYPIMLVGLYRHLPRTFCKNTTSPPPSIATLPVPKKPLNMSNRSMKMIDKLLKHQDWPLEKGSSFPTTRKKPLQLSRKSCPTKPLELPEILVSLKVS